MSGYRFEAVRNDGETVRGAIEAASSSAVLDVLAERGLVPFVVEPAREAPALLRRRVAARDRATALRSLASLTEAGIPLEKSLGVTARLLPGAMGKALLLVQDAVREGASLGSAMAREESTFTPVVVGLVQAGERGVGLGTALAQAAAQVERQAETSARLRAALAYPILLAVIGAVSITFIAAFVVPRFATILADVGQELPAATRVLLDLSAVLRQVGLPLLVLAIAAVAWAARLPLRRRIVSEWLLRMPVLGTVAHSLATARTARTLGALLGTGTPALVALRAASDAAGQQAVAERLTRAGQMVREGTSLSAALRATRALTPLTLQLLTIGEESGRVPTLLERAATMEELEAERRLKGVLALLEPLLILAFAGVIAFVAAALLQAVYALRPA